MPKFTSLPAARAYARDLMTQLNEKTGKLKTGSCRFSVGGNLYLDIAAGGQTAQWMFLYKIGKKQREMFLGSADVIKVDMAKNLGLEAYVTLKLRRQDPLTVRDQTAAIAPQTIAALVEEVIDARQSGWVDAEKGAQKYRGICKTHMPELMGLLSTQITFELLRATFKPQWDKQRAFQAQDIIEAALDLAVNKGQIARNPAKWEGGLATVLGKKVTETKGRDAMDAADVPAFVAMLLADDSNEARILLAIVLTGMREAAVSGMHVSELDLDAGCWTVPANRMKRKKGQRARDFKVALSRQMVALIKAQPAHATGLVFPSQRGKLMSNQSLNNKMRALGLKPAINDAESEVENNDIHGYRKTLSTWANNNTDHDSRAIDMALGHVQKANGELSSAEADYNEADYFMKRVPLMQDWADYVFAVKAPANTNQPADMEKAA